MGIKNELDEAKSRVASYVDIRTRVKELALAEAISDSEAANWLALKGVHQLVPAYHRYPIGYVVEKLSLTSDDKKAMFYKPVYDTLFNIVRPSFLAIAQILELVNERGASAPVVVWVRTEIDAFITENSVSSTEDEARTPGIANGDTGIVAVRRDKLLRIARSKFDDVKNIPIGGKKELKSELIDSDPRTFTSATFDVAWKALSTSGAIGIAGKEGFASGRDAGGD